MDFGKLTFLKKDGSDGSCYQFKCESCSIGASINATIRLKIKDPAIKNVHCVVDVDKEGVALLTNKAPLNPVKINGQDLLKYKYLRSGDIITILDKRLRYTNETLSNTLVEKFQHEKKLPARTLKAARLGRFSMHQMTPIPVQRTPAKKKRSSSFSDLNVIEATPELFKTPGKRKSDRVKMANRCFRESILPTQLLPSKLPATPQMKKGFEVNTPSSATKPTLRNKIILKNAARRSSQLNMRPIKPKLPPFLESEENADDTTEALPQLHTPDTEALDADNSFSTPHNNTSVVIVESPIEEATPVRSLKSRAKNISIQRLLESDDSVSNLATPNTKTPLKGISMKTPKSALKKTMTDQFTKDIFTSTPTKRKSVIIIEDVSTREDSIISDYTEESVYNSSFGEPHATASTNWGHSNNTRRLTRRNSEPFKSNLRNKVMNKSLGMLQQHFVDPGDTNKPSRKSARLSRLSFVENEVSQEGLEGTLTTSKSICHVTGDLSQNSSSCVTMRRPIKKSILNSEKSFKMDAEEAAVPDCNGQNLVAPFIEKFDDSTTPNKIGNLSAQTRFSLKFRKSNVTPSDVTQSSGPSSSMNSFNVSNSQDDILMEMNSTTETAEESSHNKPNMPSRGRKRPRASSGHFLSSAKRTRYDKNSSSSDMDKSRMSNVLVENAVNNIPRKKAVTEPRLKKDRMPRRSLPGSRLFADQENNIPDDTFSIGNSTIESVDTSSFIYVSGDQTLEKSRNVSSLNVDEDSKYSVLDSYCKQKSARTSHRQRLEQEIDSYNTPDWPKSSRKSQRQFELEYHSDSLPLREELSTSTRKSERHLLDDENASNKTPEVVEEKPKSARKSELQQLVLQNDQITPNWYNTPNMYGEEPKSTRKSHRKNDLINDTPKVLEAQPKLAHTLGVLEEKPKSARKSELQHLVLQNDQITPKWYNTPNMYGEEPKSTRKSHQKNDFINDTPKVLEAQPKSAQTPEVLEKRPKMARKSELQQLVQQNDQITPKWYNTPNMYGEEPKSTRKSHRKNDLINDTPKVLEAQPKSALKSKRKLIEQEHDLNITTESKPTRKSHQQLELENHSDSLPLLEKLPTLARKSRRHQLEEENASNKTPEVVEEKPKSVRKSELQQLVQQNDQITPKLYNTPQMYAEEPKSTRKSHRKNDVINYTPKVLERDLNITTESNSARKSHVQLELENHSGSLSLLEELPTSTRKSRRHLSDEENVINTTPGVLEEKPKSARKSELHPLVLQNDQITPKGYNTPQMYGEEPKSTRKSYRKNDFINDTPKVLEAQPKSARKSQRQLIEQERDLNVTTESKPTRKSHQQLEVENHSDSLPLLEELPTSTRKSHRHQSDEENVSNKTPEVLEEKPKSTRKSELQQLVLQNDQITPKWYNTPQMYAEEPKSTRKSHRKNDLINDTPKMLEHDLNITTESNSARKSHIQLELENHSDCLPLLEELPTSTRKSQRHLSDEENVSNRTPGVLEEKPKSARKSELQQLVLQNDQITPKWYNTPNMYGEEPKSTRKSHRKYCSINDTPKVLKAQLKSARKSQGQLIEQEHDLNINTKSNSARKSYQQLELEDLSDTLPLPEGLTAMTTKSHRHQLDEENDSYETLKVLEENPKPARKSELQQLVQQNDLYNTPKMYWEEPKLSRKSQRQQLKPENVLNNTPKMENEPRSVRISNQQIIEQEYDVINSPETRQMEPTSARKSRPHQFEEDNDFTDTPKMEDKEPKSARKSQRLQLDDTLKLHEGQQKLLRKSQQVNDLNDTPESISNSQIQDSKRERLVRTRRLQNEPLNDLSSPRGVKQLMKTPKVQHEPENDLTSPRGVKQLMKTPKVQHEPENDLTSPRGVKQLMKTPKVQREPENDLTSPRGVKQLMKTPKVQREPENDLTSPRGVKQLMKTPKLQREPKNDLTKPYGVKQMLRTPKLQNAPKDDLSNPLGVKQLMRSPKTQKEPKNDLSNPLGVKRLMKTPRVTKSPKNDLSDVDGLIDLFDADHRNISFIAPIEEDCANDIFQPETSLRTYSRKSRTPGKPKPNAFSTIDADNVEISPYVEKWIADQASSSNKATENISAEKHSGNFNVEKLENSHATSLIKKQSTSKRNRKGDDTTYTNKEAILDSSLESFKNAGDINVDEPERKRSFKKERHQKLLEATPTPLLSPITRRIDDDNSNVAGTQITDFGEESTIKNVEITQKKKRTGNQKLAEDVPTPSSTSKSSRRLRKDIVIDDTDNVDLNLINVQKLAEATPISSSTSKSTRRLRKDIVKDDCANIADPNVINVQKLAEDTPSLSSTSKSTRRLRKDIVNEDTANVQKLAEEVPAPSSTSKPTRRLRKDKVIDDTANVADPNVINVQKLPEDISAPSSTLRSTRRLRKDIVNNDSASVADLIMIISDTESDLDDQTNRRGRKKPRNQKLAEEIAAPPSPLRSTRSRNKQLLKEDPAPSSPSRSTRSRTKETVVEAVLPKRGKRGQKKIEEPEALDTLKAEDTAKGKQNEDDESEVQENDRNDLIEVPESETKSVRSRRNKNITDENTLEGTGEAAKPSRARRNGNVKEKSDLVEAIPDEIEPTRSLRNKKLANVKEPIADTDKPLSRTRRKKVEAEESDSEEVIKVTKRKGVTSVQIKKSNEQAKLAGEVTAAAETKPNGRKRILSAEDIERASEVPSEAVEVPAKRKRAARKVKLAPEVEDEPQPIRKSARRKK